MLPLIPGDRRPDLHTSEDSIQDQRGQKAMLGLTKKYSIGTGSSGQIQLLYNFLWSSQSQNGPFELRISKSI